MKPESPSTTIEVGLGKECGAGGRFRIACWPPQTPGNSYFDSFYGELQRYGAEWVGGAGVTREWLKSAAGKIEGVHFHWPEGIWERRGKSVLRRAKVIAGLYRYLQLAARMGLKRIWTVHDLEHHDGNDWADWAGYRVLARGCDLIICHSQWCANQVGRRFRPRGAVVVMPHGNYWGHYPEPRDRGTVLSEIGLDPGKPAICCVGHLRHYKGLDIAVDGVRRREGQVQLIIAGLPHAEFDLAGLKRNLELLNGGVLIPEEVPSQWYADLVGACEAVVLPYRKITSSGALLSACSLGRGVIASDLPYFREMCEPEPDAAELFHPGDGRAFAEAIDRYLARRSDERNGAARRLAARFCWQRTITRVGEMVQGWSRQLSTTNGTLLRRQSASTLCVTKE